MPQHRFATRHLRIYTSDIVSMVAHLTFSQACLAVQPENSLQNMGMGISANALGKAPIMREISNLAFHAWRVSKLALLPCLYACLENAHRCISRLAWRIYLDKPQDRPRHAWSIPFAVSCPTQRAVQLCPASAFCCARAPCPGRRRHPHHCHCRLAAMPPASPHRRHPRLVTLASGKSRWRCRPGAG